MYKCAQRIMQRSASKLMCEVDGICNFILLPPQGIHNYLLKALSSPFKILEFDSMVVHSGILTVLVIIAMIMNFKFSPKDSSGLVGIFLSYPHTFLSVVLPRMFHGLASNSSRVVCNVFGPVTLPVFYLLHNLYICSSVPVK